MALYTNRLRSSFDIIWKADNNLEGKITISHVEDGVKGKIKTKPYRKNRLRGEFETNLPQREVIETDIVKDTYVTDLTPTLNNGNLEILKIGVDEQGYKYRSFIKPSIPKEVQNKHILKAELILQSNEQVSFKDLEISLPNSDWQEYNMVWLGQPSRKEILYTSDLKGNTYIHSLDLTEIFNKEWIFSKGENFGIILRSSDESKQQLINFSSRESYNPPKFRITYIDKDLFLQEGAVMSGRIRPTYRTHHSMNGRVDVWRDNDVRGIDGKVKVHRDDTLEGVVSTSAKKDLKGKLTIKDKFSEIKGKVFSNIEWVFGQVKVKSFKNLQGKVRLRPNSTISGKINVVYKNQIDGKVMIRPLKYSDLNGKIKTSSKTDLKGKINVVYKNQIDGKVSVKQFYDLEGRVRPTIELDNQIEGILTTILKTQLVGRIKVNQIALPSKVTVRGKNEIEGQIITRGLTELEGRILTAMKSELDGTVISRAKEINELNGKVLLGEKVPIEDDEIYVFIM